MFVGVSNVSPPFRVTFLYEKSLIEWSSVGIPIVTLGAPVTYTAVELERKGELEAVYRAVSKGKARTDGTKGVPKSGAEAV